MWICGALLTGALMTALTAEWARRRLVVVTVRGQSMSPTFAPGDRVLVRRGPRGVRPGAVVVVGEPDARSGWRHKAPVGASRPSGESWYIKRVVAVAGDPYPPAVGRSGDVPSGHVALLGDHPVSVDSRDHGPCPAHQVLGVVVRRFRDRTPDHPGVPRAVSARRPST